MIKSVQDINHLVKLFAYLNATLFATFFINWQGQKIIDSSEKVFESAYVLYNIKNNTFEKVILIYNNVTKR